MKGNQTLFYERKEKSRYRYGQPDKKTAGNGFKCAHCQGFVRTEPGFSGVQNRNHCPYCLWSRHLDLYAAGDRLSACKSLMRPIGLTIKATRKKYGLNRGELMLIHLCEECRALSINRIAADDDPQTVNIVFEDSFRLDISMQVRVNACGIRMLDGVDRDTVLVRLFAKHPDPTGMFFLGSTLEIG